MQNAVTCPRSVTAFLIFTCPIKPHHPPKHTLRKD